MIELTGGASRQFERGTISYNIYATLTRPIKIGATMNCDRKVSLVEKVDVGKLKPPRPRTIFLEPISKKTRRKKSARGDRRLAPRELAAEPSSDVDSVGPSVVSEDPSHEPQSIARTNSEHHDSRSLFSGDSNFSASTGVSLTPADVLSQTSNPPTVRTTPSLAKLQAVDAKTITTTIELLKGGCLAGDTIPIRVTVQHIKRVKSLHGVIVTLYRQGRIDPRAQPNARDTGPQTTTSNENNSRSKARIYRKDLCQTMAPLIIDPVSLSTSVSVSVRVPENAFPTIKDVPGEMISFKYQLEVIVDLGGRLEGQLLSSSAGSQTRFGTNAANGSATEGMHTSWSTNVINTEHLRREKGVVYDALELVVGTLDSKRLRGKTSSNRPLYHANASSASQEEMSSPWRRDSGAHVSVNGDHRPSPRLPSRNYSTPPPLPEDHPYPELHEPHTAPPPPPPVRVTSPATDLSAPAYVPPPDLPNDNDLSEKERVRLQEQRLLPSRPPQSPSEAGPSAPGPSAPETAGSAASLPSAPLEEDIYDAENTPPAPPADIPTELEPSAPTLDDIQAPQPQNGPDKLELERQRLLNEASAPPEFPDNVHASGSGTRGEADQGGQEPSAPVFSDEEEYGAHYAYSTEVRGASSEPLPRYER